MLSCQTALVFKNITVTLSEEAAHWARIKAVEENTSVSRPIGKIIEAQMLRSDDYSDAYRRWKELQAMDLDVAHRLSREDAHARR